MSYFSPASIQGPLWNTASTAILQCGAVLTRSIFSKLITTDTYSSPIRDKYRCLFFKVRFIFCLRLHSGVCKIKLNRTITAKGFAWWRHQMETFSALIAGEFPAQRPVTRSFDVFFDLRLNKRLSKQSWCWWFETLSCPLWRHRNGKRCLIVLPWKHLI